MLVEFACWGETGDENKMDRQGDAGPVHSGNVSGGLVSTLIPYRNPKALAAYYAGFFAFIPLVGIPVALAAIVLGILGVRYTLAHREAKGIAHAIIGIVLGAMALSWNPFYTFVIGWLIRSGYFQH
jgi:hypothetical protein